MRQATSERNCQEATSGRSSDPARNPVRLAFRSRLYRIRECQSADARCLWEGAAGWLEVVLFPSCASRRESSTSRGKTIEQEHKRKATFFLMQERQCLSRGGLSIFQAHRSWKDSRILGTRSRATHSVCKSREGGSGDVFVSQTMRDCCADDSSGSKVDKVPQCGEMYMVYRVFQKKLEQSILLADIDRRFISLTISRRNTV